jgi:demethylmenaquinone methyltransferase/2-methoxy-6-polyprenyl-1,4-benzoquinol methylase
VRRSKAAARRSYNRMSRWYDLFARSERRFTLRALELLAPAQGETILEAGFGTGENLLHLAQTVGEGGGIHGIDISEAMCALARYKLERRGLKQRVTFTCGDAAALPYRAESFDALFAGFTLELFDTPELPEVLAEWRRVLRPEGRIVITALQKERGLVVALYEWLHERFPAAIDCRPIRAAEALERAGFRITAAERRSMWGLPVAITLAHKE